MGRLSRPCMPCGPMRPTFRSWPVTDRGAVSSYASNTNHPSPPGGTMSPRMNLAEVAPDAYKAVLGLELYARTNVDHTLYELVKLRASMINGCAYCVDMHSRD